MSGIFRFIRYCLWLPFKLLTSPILIAIFLGVMTYCYPPMFPILLFACIVVAGLCLPLEAALRSVPRNKQAPLPKRSQPIASSEARDAIKGSTKPPSHRTILRHLPAELQAIVGAETDRQPEAIAHSAQVAQQATQTVA